MPIQRLPKLCSPVLFWICISMGAAHSAEGNPTSVFSSLLEWVRSRIADVAPQREHESPKEQYLQEERQPGDAGAVSPSHVYQAVLDLIAEVVILRHAVGVSDAPGEAVIREGSLPVHVYAKSMEVMEKVARLQTRLNLTPMEVGRIPVKYITPLDVYHNVQKTVGELRVLKQQLAINSEILPVPYSDGRRNSLVYKKLGDASLLLDSLVGGPTGIRDIHVRVFMIHQELRPIADRLNVALETVLPEVERNRQTQEIAQQLLRCLYKVMEFQSALGIGTSSISNFSIERATPSQVFDATNILLAEVARIRFHMNIRVPTTKSTNLYAKEPADLFAEVLLMIRNLDLMIDAADRFS